MTRFLWLLGLSIIVAIISVSVSAFHLRQRVPPALSSAARPSTIIAVAPANSNADGDRLTHPPIRQAFTFGPYQLVISAEDNWKTPLTQAEFFKGDTVLWKKALPHQYGPKFVLIGTQGNVLLLDEFINVASPHAITLISTQGQVIAQHSFKDIHTTLNLAAADLTQQATIGWWISAAPTLITSENRATVRTGGTTLTIDLETGAIQPRDPSTI